jgi:hypothetical protein
MAERLLKIALECALWVEGTVPSNGSRRIVIGREGFAQVIFNIGSVRPHYDEQLWTLVFRAQSGSLSEDERLFVTFLQRLPLLKVFLSSRFLFCACHKSSDHSSE